MKIDDLYLSSPIWMQNLAVAGYGYVLRGRRFGPGFEKVSRQLAASEFLGSEELRALQEHNLASIVRHAFAHVPHYRDLAKTRRLTSRDITLDTLSQALPILNKEEVRAAPERFISEAPDGRLLKINTSGTTGSPLTVICTRNALRANYAFFARFLGWHGVSPRSRSATFAGRALVSPQQSAPPFWRTNPALNDLQFSSYHLSPSYLQHYAEQLERWEPDYIDAYPSSGAIVASFIATTGRHVIRPKVIVTSSETLLNHQRVSMTQAFKCPVRDQYGSAEMVAFLAECEHGTLHSMPEYGILEIVSTPESEALASGEIVATGFINPAMPLLRYRLGDNAISSDLFCSCGRQFPTLEKVVGRRDDFILTPNGARIGRLDPIFKGADGVLECQIVQDRIDIVVIRAVLVPGYGKEALDKVAMQLRQRLPESMEVLVEIVESLPRTRSGKLRAVVSNLPHGGNVA